MAYSKINYPPPQRQLGVLPFFVPAAAPSSAVRPV